MAYRKRRKMTGRRRKSYGRRGKKRRFRTYTMARGGVRL